MTDLDVLRKLDGSRPADAAVDPTFSLRLDGVLPPPAGHVYAPLCVASNPSRRKLVAQQLSVNLVALLHSGSVAVSHLTLVNLFHRWCATASPEATWRQGLCRVRSPSSWTSHPGASWLVKAGLFANFGVQLVQLARSTWQQHAAPAGVPLTLAQKELRALLDVGNFARANAVAEEIVQAYVAAGRRVPTAMLAQMAEVCLAREAWTAAERWARLALARGDVPQAAEMLAQAQLGQGAVDAAEATLSRLIAEQRATPETQRRLGEVQLAQHQYEVALATYDALLTGDVSLVGAAVVDVAKVGRALALQGLGRTEAAVAAFRDLQAIQEAGPMHVDAVRMRAVDLFASQLYEETEQALRSIASRPGAEGYLRPSERRRLAQAQEAQRDLGVAAVNYTTYLADRPDDAAARTWLQRIEARQQVSYLPPLEALPWRVGELPLGPDDRCVISMAPYAELLDPVMFARGNGRYLFSYRQLQLWHDRVLKDFFDDRPFDGTQLTRVQPHVKSSWTRAVDNGWIPWRRPGA